MTRPPASCSDRDLLRGFYRGEEAAFDALLRRWEPRLLRFYRNFGFAPEDAADLFQEFSVRLYLTREQLLIDLSIEAVAPYLQTIARNVARRELHRRRQQEAREAHSAGLRLCRAVGLPDEVIEDVLEEITRLPSLEQQYLRLCKNHGLGELSHSEIAGVLGTSPQYITHISGRSLQRLRKRLLQAGYRIPTHGTTRSE